MMAYELKGKTILITGAAGGIGAAAARELYARGAQLVLTDLRQRDVDTLSGEFDASRCLALAMDVTDMAATRAVVAQAVDRFGRLDIAFANAGIAWTRPKTVLTADEAEFERIIEVDLLGVWRTVKAALPEVLRNAGQVVATSSIYAFLNGTINAPYALSKSAVESLMRSVRSELAGTGASASTLYPGWVETTMTDVAFGGNESVTRLLKNLFPGPLRTRVPPERIARDFADGLERRTPRIFSPARWVPIALFRGVINAIFDHRLDNDSRAQRLIRQIETESRAP